MAQICEAIMIIAFGISWPVNVYKSLKTKSTKGKSLLFLLLIAFGYVSGITGKIISDNITWVFAFYILNLLMVSADIAVFAVNKKRENKEKSRAENNPMTEND